MSVVRRSSVLAVARRHRWLLCTAAAGGPLGLTVTAGALGGVGPDDLVAVPLAGSPIELWLVLSCYAGLISCPLLSWVHSDVERSAPRFRSTALLFPHGLAVLLGALSAVVLIAGGPGRVATFWVAAAMAGAALATAGLGELGWVCSLVGGFVVLDQVGQGHLAVYRSEEETAIALAAWAVAQVLCLARAAYVPRTE